MASMDRARNWRTMFHAQVPTRTAASRPSQCARVNHLATRLPTGAGSLLREAGEGEGSRRLGRESVCSYPGGRRFKSCPRYQRVSGLTAVHRLASSRLRTCDRSGQVWAVTRTVTQSQTSAPRNRHRVSVAA